MEWIKTADGMENQVDIGTYIRTCIPMMRCTAVLTLCHILSISVAIIHYKTQVDVMLPCSDTLCNLTRVRIVSDSHCDTYVMTFISVAVTC